MTARSRDLVSPYRITETENLWFLLEDQTRTGTLKAIITLHCSLEIFQLYEVKEQSFRS